MRFVIAIVLGISSQAFAQPGMTPPAGEPAEAKSGATAVMLSIGATVAGIAVAQASPELGIVGVVVGPSAGRWYNHEVGAVGMLARATSVLVVANGIARLDNGGCEAWYSDEECREVEEDAEKGALMVYGGIALWGAATLYDFVEAGRGSARYNQRLRVVPTMTTQQTGIAVVGTF